MVLRQAGDRSELLETERIGIGTVGVIPGATQVPEDVARCALPFNGHGTFWNRSRVLAVSCCGSRPCVHQPAFRSSQPDTRLLLPTMAVTVLRPRLETSASCRSEAPTRCATRIMSSRIS